MLSLSVFRGDFLDVNVKMAFNKSTSNQNRLIKFMLP